MTLQKINDRKQMTKVCYRKTMTLQNGKRLNDRKKPLIRIDIMEDLNIKLSS